MFMWIIVPIILTVVYIKNMQGKMRSCFIYSESSDPHVFRRTKENKENDEKICKRFRGQFILFILSMILMITIILVFLMTENNLYNMESSSAIIKILVLRFVIGKPNHKAKFICNFV